MIVLSGGASTASLLESAGMLCNSRNSWERETGAFLNEWFNDKDYIDVHTSGSTGEPKAIQLLKSNVRASAIATCDYFGIDASSKLLLCMSTRFIAGKLMIIRAFTAGADIMIVEPSSDPVERLNMDIDFAAMVPMQVEKSLEHSKSNFNRIKQLIIGGAPVSHNLAKKLESHPGRYYCTYGMTETITHVAVNEIGTNEPQQFKAIAPIRFSVDDRGCLVIDLPHMDSPPVVTNDLVDLHCDTEFTWLGRIDSIINTGGVKVIPERIEEKLSTLITGPYFITGTTDETLGTTVTLVVESGTQIPGDDVLKSILDKYEVPRKILTVNTFTYTGSGKIDRMATLNS